VSEQPPPVGDRPHPGRADAAGVRPGVPRWVKTLGIVLAVLLLLALLVMLASGGQHGPGRHRSAPIGQIGPAVASVSLLIGTW
jgi:hypothetical protein